jgi:hypothetical protein
MGFWSTVGDIAKGMAAKAAELPQEINELAEKYRREDDDFLKNKYRNGSAVQKIAAAKILKERGYLSQD